MHQLITILLLTLFSFTANAEKNTALLPDSSTCSFEKKHGMLDGEYKSFYSNGKLKCEGSFLQNNRFGLWVFYKIDGGIQCIRDYKNNYSYEEKTSNNKLEKVLWNENNVWCLIQQKDVISKNRYQTTILQTDNETLFTNETLINNIIIAHSAGKKELFIDGRFVSKVDDKILKNAPIVGFRLKEDRILDQTTKCLHYRIIGVAPLIYSAEEKRNIELCWIYYPDIKSELSKINLKTPTMFCKTLADIFEFRSFAGETKNYFFGSMERTDETALSLNLTAISDIEKENTFILSNFSIK